MAGRSRFWVFTKNNPPEGEDLNPAGWIPAVEYMVYQLEQGIADTEHFQGYVVFFKQVRFNVVKNLIGGNPHIEQREGTHEQAKAYCMKPQTRVSPPKEFGDDTNVASKAGSRMDLKRARAALDSGMKMKQFSEEYFPVYIKYERNISKYQYLHRTPRKWEMEIITLIGPTGSGKTRYVYDRYPEDEIYSLPPPKGSGTYWDGYDGEETVLIDEVYGNRFSHGALLMLLDRYPLQVPVHGGAVEFVSKRIVMTSNAHPRDWYSSDKFTYEDGPLHRRLTQNGSHIVELFPVIPQLNPATTFDGIRPDNWPTSSVLSYQDPLDNNNNQ